MEFKREFMIYMDRYDTAAVERKIINTKEVMDKI